MKVLEILLPGILAILLVVNLLLTVIIAGDSLDNKMLIFQSQKELVIDLYKNRNLFGYVLCTFIFICLLPGFILGTILHIVGLIVIGIWKLGKKKDFR